MKRSIEKELVSWKEQNERLPLILRGARQVGKSYVIEKFGQDHFKNTVVIDFEYRPEFGKCFENTLDPQQIISYLEMMTESEIIPGKTLLFLDEIQECSRAIMALRYFKEKMPKLHVIAAGSLLEFVINEADFSFPVGRVQYMFMHPLSFREFLENMGETKVVQYLDLYKCGETLAEPIHDKLLHRLKQYFLIGGMPAVVQKFIDTGSFVKCRQLQLALLQTYRNDFGKYASQAQHKYLQKLFEKAPKLVAEHFKYVKVDQEMRSREIKKALEQLSNAGLIYRIYRSAASGIPLEDQADHRFKLLFLDIGLMQTAHKVDIQEIWDHDIFQIHSGRLAEQFVGQELLAYSDPYDEPKLYFWKKEDKSSTAEVDYVITIQSKIIPVEVKSGTTGRRRSLRMFMNEKKLPCGVKISTQPLSSEKNILFAPLYMIEQIDRLVREQWL